MGWGCSISVLYWYGSLLSNSADACCTDDVITPEDFGDLATLQEHYLTVHVDDDSGDGKQRTPPDCGSIVGDVPTAWGEDDLGCINDYVHVEHGVDISYILPQKTEDNAPPNSSPTPFNGVGVTTGKPAALDSATIRRHCAAAAAMCEIEMARDDLKGAAVETGGASAEAREMVEAINDFDVFDSTHKEANVNTNTLVKESWDEVKLTIIRNSAIVGAENAMGAPMVEGHEREIDATGGAAGCPESRWSRTATSAPSKHARCWFGR